MAKEIELDLAELEELLGGALSDEPDAARLEVFRDQVLAKSWEQLEAVERGDHLLFPEKLWKRKKSGKFEVTEVMIQVPRLGDMRKARALAQRIAAEDGIDPKRDPTEFDNLESSCILAYAVRERSHPYSFLFAADKDTPDVRMLERSFDEGSLSHLFARLAPYKAMLNPQVAKLTRDDFIAIIAAIAERRDIGPLHATDGPTQSACIVTMASLLMSLMTRRPSSPSPETSTRESSDSESSTSSSAENESPETS